MKSKFDKYLGDPEKMNKVIFLAAIVDPTQKLSYVKYVCAKLYGEQKGKQLIAKITEALCNIFSEYEARSSIQVLATNKSSPTVVDFQISSAEDDQNDMSDFIQWHANEKLFSFK